MPASGALTIANNAVTTAKIAGGSGTVTVANGANINNGRCADIVAPGTSTSSLTISSGTLAANDYVLLQEPSTAGWTAQEVSSTSSTMTVRVCNQTGATANPTFTLRWQAIR